MFYVYTILNLQTYKIYVGQTKNIKNRWAAHRCEAKSNRLNYPLYNSLRKYGFNNFQVSMVDWAESIEQIDLAEQYWIQYFDSRGEFGYNIAPGGSVARGWHHTKESKKKISESNIGKKCPHSKEWSEKVSATQMGHLVKEETRLKISKAKIGKKHSDKSKQKMSESHIGMIFSDETKQKMSKSSLGKKKSEQAKTNMSKAFRTFSNEKELEIIEEFNSGFSVADLSKIYSCSKGVIYNLFKRHKNEKEDTSNTLLRFLQR